MRINSIQCLKNLTEFGFWLSDIQIKGVPRLSKESLDAEFKGNLFKKLMKGIPKESSGLG